MYAWEGRKIQTAVRVLLVPKVGPEVHVVPLRDVLDAVGLAGGIDASLAAVAAVVRDHRLGLVDLDLEPAQAEDGRESPLLLLLLFLLLLLQLLPLLLQLQGGLHLVLGRDGVVMELPNPRKGQILEGLRLLLRLLHLVLGRDGMALVDDNKALRLGLLLGRLLLDLVLVLARDGGLTLGLLLGLLHLVHGRRQQCRRGRGEHKRENG
ncbi:hypothetical protein PG988_010396 [Apiospora saccharicola]